MDGMGTGVCHGQASGPVVLKWMVRGTYCTSLRLFIEMIGAERSFVTVGRSFTVAKGFSPLRKGGFGIPLASFGGGGASDLDTGPLKVEVALGPVLCSDIASP